MAHPQLLLLLVMLVGHVVGKASNVTEPTKKNESSTPIQAEDESCGGPAEKADLPVIRAIRQITFPGAGPTIVQGRPIILSSGGGGAPCANCVPIVACSFILSQVQQTCPMPDGSLGVCCPVQPQQTVGQGDLRLFKEPRPQVQMRPLSPDMINTACQKGINMLNEVGEIESKLVSNNIVVEPGTPAHGHLRFFRVTRSARQSHQQALAINQASRAMLNDFSLSPQQGSQGLRQFSVRNSILGNNCPSAPSCNPRAKYRTIDGTCNNLENAMHGKSETAFQRIVPPKYDDGVSSPRTKSVTGGDLPLERVVASTILVDRDDPDQHFTLSVMQWAQFIDHDLTHTPFSRLPNNEGIECCPNGRETPAANRHPECWPVRLPQDDPFYAPKGRSCMNFVRSMLGLNQECTFGYAEQMNQITHWLDASNVYGSTNNEARRVRSGVGGLLLTSENNLLPFDQVSGGECEARTRGRLCYIAGDSRVNEQPGLTAIHTLFHREHNRVARGLGQVNPGWSDEALYQEARRIVTAEMQHIIFNEWLPVIVGSNFMESFGLNPQQRGFSFDYNFNINPNVNNEFATAAFRFGHSLVQANIRLVDANNQMRPIRLREHFNSPHIFQEQPGVLDMFSRAFTQQAIQKFDSFVTDDLSNHLFQTPRANFGMDLMSLNLHRGRDHGIASYNAIREICGLSRARTWADFNDQIPNDIVARMSHMYAHVDDVDFFVGGMSEKPVSGGLLGWTFLCVVGDQFARVKKGDRFFYDMGGQPGSFTEQQLQQIRQASWARILCDNSDNLNAVQPLAFRLASRSFNAPQSCQGNAIPRVNLLAWQGERPQA